MMAFYLYAVSILAVWIAVTDIRSNARILKADSGTTAYHRIMSSVEITLCAVFLLVTGHIYWSAWYPESGSTSPDVLAYMRALLFLALLVPWKIALGLVEALFFDAEENRKAQELVKAYKGDSDDG